MKIVTGGNDKVIRIYNQSKIGSKRSPLVASQQLSEKIKSIAFSHDGENFAVGYSNGSLELFETESLDSLNSVQLTDKAGASAKNIYFSPDDSMIATSILKDITILEFPTLKVKKILTDCITPVIFLQFSDCGKFLKANTSEC
jgi:WD40 repeat protein